MSAEQQYIDLYTTHSEAIKAHSAGALNDVRDEALTHFRRLGFPTRKDERYRYTSVDELFAPDYGVNINRIKAAYDPYNTYHCDVPKLSTSLYFVLNDSFYDSRRYAGHLPEGVTVCSLCKAAVEQPLLVSRYYSKAADVGTDAVTALNTMMAQDGLFVHVPKGVVVERTVQIINMLCSEVDLMVNRRVLIVVEDNAALRLLFCDHTADDRRFLTTQVIEVYVGNNASLELYCMEETHAKNTRVSNLYIRQQADSRVVHNIITLHNGITRNRTDLMLCGEGAECDLCGCVTADKNQHVDNNTLIVHRAPGCTSRELYKYVLDGKATGAFAGKVLVEKGAQKSISEEVNQNLCATKEARMFTQPMLEIYADDVKCSHGSTVGQLNDAALFYMQQRGISLEEARTLLEMAFINEVVDHIRLEPLRDRLHYLIEQRFRGKLNKCEGCRLCE